MSITGKKTYVGIEQDENGGMTYYGLIVRDAWVFGLIPETETCAGWDAAQFQLLHDKVAAAWNPCGHLPSQLPEELRERHARIHGAALARARQMGWDAELDEDD